MLKKIFFAFFAFIFIFLSAIVFVGYSAVRSAWFLATLKQNTSFFSYNTFQGALLKEFRFQGLTFQSSEQRIQIGSFHLAWQPEDLFKGVLTLQEIQARDVRWDIFEWQASNSPPSEIALPWWLSRVDLSKVSVQDFYLHEKKNRFAWQNADLAGMLSGSKLSLDLHVQNVKNISSEFSSSLDGEVKEVNFEALGKMNDYRWALQLDKSRFEGQGTEKSIRLEKITSTLWPKNLTILASYEWGKLSKFMVRLAGRFDPSIWSKKMSGDLAVEVEFSGALPFHEPQKNQVHLNLKSLSGVLQGGAVQGSGEMNYVNTTMEWKNFVLKAGKSLLQLDGNFSSKNPLHWNIQIDNLAHWFPKSSGIIHSQGSAEGGIFTPSVQGAAEIHNFRLFDIEISQLIAKANLGGSAKNFILNLSVREARFFNQYFKSIQLVTEGREDQQSIQGKLQHEFGSLAFSLSGGFRENTWQGRLQSLNLQPEGFLRWQLKQAVNLSLSESRFAMKDPLCLGQGAQSICLAWSDKKVLSLDVQSLRLAPWQRFIPSIQKLEGQLELHAKISHFSSTPKVELKGAIQNAGFYSPDYNVLFSPISLNFFGNAEGGIQFSGEIFSDKNPLSVSGSLKKIFEAPLLEMKIKGQDFLVSHLPSYKVWLSPDLILKYENSVFDLSGSLLIPKAKLSFVDYSSNIVSLTSDVSYVGEEESALQFIANIGLHLGDDVTLKYGGLTGKLTGAMNIKQPLLGAATATGSIHLKEGKYKAYGQALSIQKGEATFKGGPVDNPLLNVQAVKVLKNVAPVTADGAIVPGSTFVNPDGTLTVGVEVSGPLLQHQIKLFSDPAGLSQSDILSYLILGVPASQAGSGGGALLLSAASALGDGSKGNTITDLQNELKNTFGIEVGVGNVSQYDPSTQSVTQGTALILTKTLSPKLFLTYSAGVGSAVSTVKVHYQISHSWMAESESSSLGNGGDLYYTIDRN